MREPLKLILSAPPAGLPVGLNELRAHLRLEEDRSEEEAILVGALRTAAAACEAMTGRALITQTWTLFRDRWPGADDDPPREGLSEGVLSARGARALSLPRPPLQSIAHVKTFAADDSETLWPANSYYADTAGVPGRLLARAGRSFPAPGRAANGIEVRFVAGHGNAPGDVPAALRQGILHLAAHLFEHRGDGLSGAAIEAAGAAALWRPLAVARL